MDETTFWNVMEDAHRVSSGRLRGQIDAMVEALAALPLDDILAFHNRFHAAHRAAATRPLLGAASILALACTPGGRACTPEGFSAFRAWLVARGRDVYERALSDPDSLAGFVTKTPAPTGRRLFYQVPGFLEAAPRAWERVTNLPAERMPARHAADMPEGLQPPSIDAMRAECPKLVAVVESRVARAHTAFAERILMRLVMTFWPDGAYALVA